MADITEGNVLAFIAGDLRPLAELAEALAVRIGAATVRYTNQIAPILATHASGDVVADGRTDVPPITKADVVAVAVILGNIQTALTANGNAVALDKMAVRTVGVTTSVG